MAYSQLGDSPQSVRSQVSFTDLHASTSVQSQETQSFSQAAFATQAGFSISEQRGLKRSFDTISQSHANREKFKRQEMSNIDSEVFKALQKEQKNLDKENILEGRGPKMSHKNHRSTILTDQLLRTEGAQTSIVTQPGNGKKKISEDDHRDHNVLSPELEIGESQPRQPQQISKKRSDVDRRREVPETPGSRKTAPKIEKDVDKITTDSDSTSQQQFHHFQRWQSRLYAGRYMPQYATRIPRDQKLLLESKDSWQPPLVGRPQRPGTLPLDILNRATAQSMDQSRTEIRAEREKIHVTTVSNEKIDTEDDDHHDHLASSQVGSEDWPNSPSRQAFRQQPFPNSSPIEEPEEFERRLSNGTEDDQMEDSQNLPSTRQIARNQDMRNERQSSELKDLQSRESQNFHEDIVEDSFDRELMTRDNTARMRDNDDSSPLEPISIFTNDGLNENIQVKRTPYLNEEEKLAQEFSNIHQSQSVDLTGSEHLSMSSRIPGTFDDHIRHTASVLNQPDPEIPFPTEPDSNRIRGDTGKVTSHSDIGSPELGSSQSKKFIKPKSFPLTPASVPINSSNERESKGTEKMASSGSNKNLSHVQQMGSTPTSKEIQIKSCTKRSIDENSHENERSKRKRGHSMRSSLSSNVDPDYNPMIAELRQHRHNTLKSLRKQPSNQDVYTESPSSPIDLTKDNDDTPERAASRQSNSSYSIERHSTPLTSTSINPGSQIPPKRIEFVKPQSSSPLPSCSCRESSYRDFQATYPEYQGSIDNFVKACLLLNKIRDSASPLHPFLYDDAIFHHYHSYRQYLLELVESGEDALPFGAFYAKHIAQPSHLKGKINASFLDHLLDPRLCNEAPILAGTNDIHITSKPVMTQKVELKDHNNKMCLPEKAPVHRKSPTRSIDKIDTPSKIPEVPDLNSLQSSEASLHQEPPADIIDKSEPSFRQRDVSSPDPMYSSQVSVKGWIDKASGAASPELGTPEMTQTEEQIPSLDLESAAKKVSKRHRTSKRLSASPFTSTRTARASQHYWWKDENTPFKRFASHFAALPSESKKAPDTNSRTSNESESQHGINIFTWRKK